MNRGEQKIEQFKKITVRRAKRQAIASRKFTMKGSPYLEPLKTRLEDFQGIKILAGWEKEDLPD